MSFFTPTFSAFSFLLLLSACSGTDHAGASTTTPPDNAFASSLVEQPVGQSGYVLALPATYTLRESEGPDFTVYRFVPRDTTATAALYGGLYFGNHPSAFEPDAADCQKQTRQGRLLGSAEKWTVYTCADSYDIQVIADSKSGQQWNELVHAFGHGTSPQDLDKVLAIFATLKKK